MIHTRRLILRAPSVSDFEPLHAIFSNQKAMRYWDRPPHDKAATREFLNWMIESDPKTRYEFIVELDGRVVGKAGCWKIAEVGYIFHPDVWGQGIATETLNTILPGAFNKFPQIKQITAEIDPRNIASHQVLLRQGFYEIGRAERTLQVAGEWCDSVYFALDRPANDRSNQN